MDIQKVSHIGNLLPNVFSLSPSEISMSQIKMSFDNIQKYIKLSLQIIFMLPTEVFLISFGTFSNRNIPKDVSTHIIVHGKNLRMGIRPIHGGNSPWVALWEESMAIEYAHWRNS